jgi:oxaloacetate decarboxylase alpha subunit
VYSVRVNGKAYTVEVAEGGDLADVRPSAPAAAPATGAGDAVNAVLAGNIFKVNVAVGDTVQQGDALLVVEAMKMETEVAAPKAGTITQVHVAVGDVVAVGDALVAID